MHLRGLALAFVLVLSTGGCGARAWHQALALDEPAAYHRFLREHGGSSYAEEAQQRLEFARLRAHPSYEGFLAFRARYPGDPLVADLRAVVERARFDAAQAAGSVADYQVFADDFPDSDLLERARGNASYLESHGFAADPSALAGFAAQYSESDYAPEARRSLALAETARRHIRRVGLVMEVATPPRVRGKLSRDFRDRVRYAWQPLGVEVVEVPGDSDPAAEDLPALLRIQHREEEVPASMHGGVIRPSAVLARTRVLLDLGDTPEPVWRRSFELRARASRRGLDASILHSPGARDFWQNFFVPVSSWPTARAVAAPLQLSATPVAVDLEGSRAALLFADGSFEVYDIADPANPVRVAFYRRPRDLASFDGIRLRGRRAVIYGSGGIEIVVLALEGAERERQLGGEVLGMVRGVAFMENVLVAATSRGLLRIQADAPPRVWMEGAMRGVARSGAYLIFGDGMRVFSARPEDLDAGRVEGSLRIPRGLDAVEFRAGGSRLVVLGRRGVLWVDVEDPANLRLVARVESREVGQVSDAADLGGRLLLLGNRGLQVLDAGDARLVESLDVQARRRFSIWGRYAALVGDGQLQVVDLTPFLGAWRVAEQARSALQRADSSR